MAVAAAGPTYEIGQPASHHDIAPILRACDRGDALSCGYTSDFAARLGHPKLAEHLALRACRAGVVRRCTTDADRCRLGVAEACRAIDGKKPRVEMPSAEQLFVACEADDESACAYLESNRLRDIDVRFLSWEPMRQTYRLGVLVSPDGRTVLRPAPPGAHYVREGKVVGEIVLPNQLRANLRIGRWTATELWFPLYGGGDRLRGFYRNGAFEPIPEAWQDVPAQAECRPVEQFSTVVYRRCVLDRKKPSAGHRIYRMRPTGAPLPSFDVTEQTQVLGEGPEPGGLVLNARKPLYFCRVGPQESTLVPLENVERYWGQTRVNGAGRMLVSNGAEVAEYQPAAKYKWSERVKNAQITLGFKGWLLKRDERIGEHKHRVDFVRLEDATGPRTPWIRADGLFGYGREIHPHPAGFFLQGRGRGAVIRAPWSTWPERGIEPTGRITGTPNPVWRQPKARQARFRADRSGWPVVGGPLAPTEGAVRPRSRRMQDVPGLAKALKGCAEGVFAACEAINGAARHLAAVRPVLEAIRRLQCDHFEPHRCPAPTERNLPPDLAAQHHWRWSELGVTFERVVDIGWEGEVPVVWTTDAARYVNSANEPARFAGIELADDGPADGQPTFRTIYDATADRALLAFEDGVVSVGPHASKVPGVQGGQIRADGAVVLWADEGVVGWRPGKDRAVVTSISGIYRAAAPPSRRTVATLDGRNRVRVVDPMRGKVTFDWQLPGDERPYARFTSEHHLLLCGKGTAWWGDTRKSALKQVDRKPCLQGSFHVQGQNLWTIGRVAMQRWNGATLAPTSKSLHWRCQWLVERGDAVLCASKHYLTWLGPTAGARPRPSIRTRPAESPNPGAPLAVAFPTRTFRVKTAYLDGDSVDIRFDDGKVRTIDLEPFLRVSATGHIVIPAGVQPTEVVKPEGFELVLGDDPWSVDVMPFVPATLQVVGPDGKPATKVRVQGLGREITRRPAPGACGRGAGSDAGR